MWSILLGLALAAEADLPDHVAIRINGESINVSEIDAPSREKIERLHATLHAQAVRTVERLIDERLSRTSAEPKFSPPTPITEQAIRELRTSRAAEFDGPLAPTEGAARPGVAEDAIRQLLHQEHVAAAETETHQHLRTGHRIRLEVPEAAELETPLPEQRTVAEIDGIPIQAADLERTAALVLYRLRKEIYLERQQNIEAVIEDWLLASEARRQGRSVENLLAEVNRGIEISDAEVATYTEKARAAGRDVANPERVRQYLSFVKAYDRRKHLLAKLRKDVHIEILLAEPQPPNLPILENDAPVLGSAKGASLVAYTNYRCTPCRSTHREIDRLLAAEPKVRVVFHDFIPVYDPVANEAARLSRCAARLGVFSQMRRELLERDPPPFGETWYNNEALQNLTARLRINAIAFRQCLEADDIRAAIQRDTAEAHGFGFEEAPSFVVQGMPLSGMQAAESFARFLHQAEAAPGIDRSRKKRR